jgi:hypothetical protein
MTKIIKNGEIPPGSIIRCFDTTKEAGLIVQFESDKFEPWIGIFKNGSTSLTKISTLTNDQVAVAAGGLLYIISPIMKAVNSFQIEYNDLQIDKDRIFIASFSLIDIYEHNQLVKRISIDGIDGIRFSSLTENTLSGEFRQIDQVDFNKWIAFKLNSLTLKLNCDFGRMWEDITYKDGVITTCYLTMGTK